MNDSRVFSTERRRAPPVGGTAAEVEPYPSQIATAWKKNHTSLGEAARSKTHVTSALRAQSFVRAHHGAASARAPRQAQARFGFRWSSPSARRG